MGEAPDFLGMSEDLGELRSEVKRMPRHLRPMGDAMLETLIRCRDRMVRDQADLARLRALLRRAHTAMSRRAHTAMSRREPDGVPVAEWDALLTDIERVVRK